LVCDLKTTRVLLPSFVGILSNITISLDNRSSRRSYIYLFIYRNHIKIVIGLHLNSHGFGF